MTGTVTKGLIQRGDFDNYDGTLASSRTSSSGGTTSGLKVGNVVDVLQVYGAGDPDNRTLATINSATGALGSTNISLIFAPGTWTIDDNKTIASNFTVLIPAGCVFSVSSGKTLTIAGVVYRHHGTYTAGDGTVTISGTDVLGSVSPSIDDNGNATAVTIDSSERVLVGHTASLTGPGGVQSIAQVITAGTSAITAARFTNDSTGANVLIFKSRDTSKGSFTVVQDDDELGGIIFGGDDGTDYQSIGATIKALVDGTPGTGDLPTRLVLATTADGAETSTERMRLDSLGNVIVGTGQLADAATDGFFYIPTTTGGAPSGTPTSYSGRVPMVYDDTNNALKIYNGSWKSVTLS